MTSLPEQKKYPRKIYVKNEVYKVVFSYKIRHYGETDFEKKLIRIRAGMSKRETFKTFLHELLHALHFEGDFDLKHKQVYALEDAIFELLVDNFI